jgi:hypothetical protein
MWDIGQWAQRWDIKVSRSGSSEANSARGISHMPDIYKSARLGFPVMNAAAAVLVTVYPTDPMKSANLVGLCELLSQQDPDWWEVDYRDAGDYNMNPRLDDLTKVIKVRFGNVSESQNSGTYHSSCKEAVNNWWKDKYDTLTNPSGISSEVKVAHATYHVYDEFSGKYSMITPRNAKGETFGVLKSFTSGYKKWLKTR